MVKLKDILNEAHPHAGAIKQNIKIRLKDLAKYHEHQEEAFKKYIKWFKLITRKPGNIDVRNAESLMKKHKELLASQFNKEVYFGIEDVINNLKQLEDD